MMLYAARLPLLQIFAATCYADAATIITRAVIRHAVLYMPLLSLIVEEMIISMFAAPCYGMLFYDFAAFLFFICCYAI